MGVSVNCPKFLCTPIISGTGKVQVWQLHSEGPSKQKPIKILEQMECEHGLPKFVGYPLLSQGRVSYTGFKFGQYIHRFHANKIPLKIERKWCVGVSRDCPNFLGTPYYLRNRKSYGFQIWLVH